MNQLSIFEQGDIAPAPGELPAPIKQKHPPLHNLKLAAFPEKSLVEYEPGHLPIMENVWRTDIGNGEVMCFVVGLHTILAVESSVAPGAFDLDMKEPGWAKVTRRLEEVGAHPPYGPTFTRERADDFRAWCGPAQWPTYVSKSREYKWPKPRPGALWDFREHRFDRNLVAQAIEVLGAFYECDQVHRWVIELKYGAALAMRGVRNNGSPGWRLWVMGREPDRVESYEVFE